MSEEKKPDIAGLERLRQPFPANQVCKLPKPTRQQTEAVKNDYKAGIRCDLCGTWHHPNVVHLDYVGHAAVTDRLLEADPEWFWKPLAFDEQGLPQLDKENGLWITLTVCGVTRLGYGDAQGKAGGDAMKERIGDAIRNAAMRFGAALDLWHKGELHVEDAEDAEKKEEKKEEKKAPEECSDELFAKNSADVFADDGTVITRGWKAYVVAGKKTPDQMIAMIESKYPLTEKQRGTIKSWQKKDEGANE